MTAQQGHQGLAIFAYSSKSNLCSRAPHWVGWSSVISASQSEALLPQSCFLLLSLRCHQSLHHSLKVIPLLLLPPNKPLAFPTLCQGLLTLGLTQMISSISSKFNAMRADTAKVQVLIRKQLIYYINNSTWWTPGWEAVGIHLMIIMILSRNEGPARNKIIIKIYQIVTTYQNFKCNFPLVLHKALWSM